MIAPRPLAAVATCALALVVAACGGAASNAAPGAAGTAGKGAEAFPASTLFFVDANADVNSSAWQKVRAVGARFPGYPKIEAKITAALSQSKDGFSFAQDIQPWAGDEAAFGVLAITLSGGQPKPQFVAYLASKDDAKAIAAITKKGEATKTGDYKGYGEYTGKDRDVFTAVGKGAVLVAGDTTALHASIDAREGDAAGRLSASPLYGEALATLPDDNVLVGYADGAKLAQLAGTAFAAAAQGDGTTAVPPAQVDQALSQLEALRAIAFSAGADDGGLRLRVSALLDEAKAKQLGQTPSAELKLLDRAPADALVYAGTPGWGDALDKAIASATSDPEVAQGIAGFEAMTGLTLKGDVLPLLSGEAGLYVSGGAPAKGALLLQPKDATAAAASLTRITAAIAKQGGAGAPTFAPLPTGEGQITTLEGHDVSWLHAGDLIALGFDTGGVAPAGGLAGSDGFRSVSGAAKLPGKVGALLYADIPGLVALAQRAGGEQVPAEALANIRALGGLLAWSTQDKGVAKGELYLQVK
ncbi:MAG: hypothetical protein QOE98_1799 [Gaiellaceae bacterium]|nr:hypothetical protein [Gaiellaceae bacterium]